MSTTTKKNTKATKKTALAGAVKTGKKLSKKQTEQRNLFKKVAGLFKEEFASGTIKPFRRYAQ